MRQLGELNQNLSQLQASNTTLIAISPDDQSTTEGFAKKLKVGFSLISDPKNEIASQYAADIKGAAMYWVRPDGRIQYGYTDPPNWLDRPPQSMVVELAQEDDPGLKKVAKVTWGLALAVTVVSFLAWGSVIDVERLALDTSDPWKLGGLTLLTPFFVHGSLLHLFGNLYFFVSFGDNVEDLLGGLRYVGLLLLAVVVSSSTFLLLHWGESIQVVGASGGVSALIVAYVLFFPRAKLATLFFWNWLIRLPSWFYLLAWIGLQLLGMQREITGPGLEGGSVAYSAHVAGALVGLLGWVLWRNRMR